MTRNKRGEVCLEQGSSFSRLMDAQRFTQAALVETQRRGLEQATEVCAVQDGAVWLQGLVDYHRADAVRILDFPHAAEYVNAIGQAVQAAGGRLPAHWLEGVLQRLKHQGPARVLTHLAFLAAHYPRPEIQELLSYLQKREAHMQYPTYQAAGWPIGSGSVESANKLVGEARLKGAGMRWQGSNVNPMLVLRNAVCNRDWQQTWTTARAHRGALRRRERIDVSDDTAYVPIRSCFPRSTVLRNPAKRDLVANVQENYLPLLTRTCEIGNEGWAFGSPAFILMPETRKVPLAASGKNVIVGHIHHYVNHVIHYPLQSTVYFSILQRRPHHHAAADRAI